MLIPEKIEDLFHVDRRFLRSVELEKDFNDPEALNGYVTTAFTRSCLYQMLEGIKTNSGRRAWRLIGDYGSGKSSFALLLAHVFQSQEKTLPLGCKSLLANYPGEVPQLLPVLITGSRRSLGVAILQGLYQFFPDTQSREEIGLILSSAARPGDQQVIHQLNLVNERLIATGKATGILLIIDEMGKFLEFSAMHPDQQDVYLFQLLAEAAVRSRAKPLFLVGILHQGFNAYFEQLGQSTQREWEKVAGRFDDILFNQPLTQLTVLIASALKIGVEHLPKSLKCEAHWRMQQALSLGLFGADASGKNLEELACQIYPLDPICLPFLVRSLQRFGQNERSLFGFISSNELFGLRSFAQVPIAEGRFFSLPHLFDYIHLNLSHRLTSINHRNHWNLIVEMVEAHSSLEPLVKDLLKCVGVINLLNANDLLASAPILVSALGGTDLEAQEKVKRSLVDLCERKKILHRRNYQGDYRLWSHTSVNLDRAYEEARAAIGDRESVAGLIKEYLDPRPIVTNRHYIETGNLRYFDLRFCELSDFSKALSAQIDPADGLIVVPLCETAEAYQTAFQILAESNAKTRPEILIAIPQTLANVKCFALEAARWNWLETHNLDLNTDRFGREAVVAQKLVSVGELKKHLEGLANLKRFSGQVGLTWVYLGETMNIPSGRALLAFLSQIFDKIFHASPFLENELINRRNISSSAASARLDLISAILTKSHLELLGMPKNQRPPEMAIYFSILKRGHLHIQTEQGWRLVIPEVDPCRLRPLFLFMEELIKKSPDQKLNVAILFREMRKPPFGVLDGVLPLILAVFSVIRKHELAFFDQGTFLTDITTEEFQALMKEPRHFEVQLCKIEGIHSGVFERLLTVLGRESPSWREPQLLDVVTPLCQFMASLPEYAQTTKNLSKQALHLRTVTLSAREPASLLFRDLPQACGLESFLGVSHIDEDQINLVIKVLKSALRELRDAYPNLLEGIKTSLQQAFEIPGRLSGLRESLKLRAKNILLNVQEPELKALCLRFIDENLVESAWLEAIGSHVQRRPPIKWVDMDTRNFTNKLGEHARHFIRVEAANFGSHGPNGVRLALTRADGMEREKVVYLSNDEEASVSDLEEKLREIINSNERLGLVAASRVLWQSLQ